MNWNAKDLQYICLTSFACIPLYLVSRVFFDLQTKTNSLFLTILAQCLSISPRYGLKTLYFNGEKSKFWYFLVKNLLHIGVSMEDWVNFEAGIDILYIFYIYVNIVSCYIEVILSIIYFFFFFLCFIKLFSVAFLVIPEVASSSMLRITSI